MDQQKALYANEKSAEPLAVEYRMNVEWRKKDEGVIHAKAEFRVKPGVKPMLYGHAAVFDQLSEELGFFDTFREIIRRGAFAETVKTADVRALFNHDPNFPLGRTRSRTLRLSEDDRGLSFEIDMPETTYARDLMTSIERGDVDQMSFAFSVPKDGDKWSRSDDGILRELIQVNLFDVSPVTFPAYPQTDVGVRAELRDLFNKVQKETEEPVIDKHASIEVPITQLSVQEIIRSTRKPMTEQEEAEKKALEAKSAERKKFLDARKDDKAPPSGGWENKFMHLSEYQKILLKAQKKNY